jgi:hypothetical protein
MDVGLCINKFELNKKFAPKANRLIQRSTLLRYKNIQGFIQALLLTPVLEKKIQLL